MADNNALAHNAARASRWMVTCFDLENFAVPDTSDDFQYMVYQVEACPNTNAWHIQGFLMLKRPLRFHQVLALFPTAVVHIDLCRGTTKHCRAYCMKQNTRVVEPVEFGTLPNSEQGNRTDLVAAATLIVAHNSWQEVVTDPVLFPIVARYSKWVESIWANRTSDYPLPDIVLRKWQQKVITLIEAGPVKRQIIWIWSTLSGTGKTTFFDYCSGKYRVLPGADWANTLYVYDGHRIIWFDRTRQESTSDKSVDQFYTDLERWSNCTYHTSTKYVPTRKLVNCLLVVTANGRPDNARLPNRFLEIEALSQYENDAMEIGDPPEEPMNEGEEPEEPMSEDISN